MIDPENVTEWPTRSPALRQVLARQGHCPDCGEPLDNKTHKCTGCGYDADWDRLL